MRGNTFVMLVIAVIFGGIAVFIANIWLKRQDLPQIAQSQPAQVEVSTIVVAARDLAFGEPLADEVLREIPWPKNDVPDGAFAKIAEVNADGTRVVLSPISPNEPVLRWKISGPGARATLSALVKEGMRAVTVRINDATGVAGFVLPGDRVDVLYTKAGNGSSIDILLQNVRVLAINQIVDEKASNPIVASVATLELMPVDAQKVSLAQTTGQLTLTLRSAGSLDKAPAQRIVEQELVSNPSVYQTAFDAQAQAQAALNARIKGLEGTVSSVENKLLTKIQSAEQSRTELMSKLAALDATVKATAKATGEGETALRKKLTDLEAAIKLAGSEGDEALRAKLAEFEASLREALAGSDKPLVIPAVATEVKPETLNIKVYRGMAENSYTLKPETAQ